jgi:molybdopterin-containing oxidoreductase family membrane subunit
MAVLNEEGKQLPPWQKTIYRRLSFNWKGTPGQKNLRTRAVRILLIMSVPVAIALHTVTSWLFALTPRIGWNSTTFGPYFVTGAFVSGVSSLIIVTFVLRKIFGLGQYLTEYHFDKLARLLVIVSLVYLYFNINEYFVPAYKASKEEAVLLKTLFAGRYAPLFWIVQFTSVLLPSFLPVLKFFRKIIPLFILGVFAFAGSWLIRYLIVIPVLENPFLPVQNVPENFIFYTPTIREVAVTLGPFLLVIMIISLLVKLFPLIPVSRAAGEVPEGVPDE